MDIILRKVRLEDNQPLVDVGLCAGKIAAIAPELGMDAAEIIEADGRVLIPGLVESHLHLDKALIADRKPNRSGTLQEAITVTAALKPSFTKEDVRERAEKALQMIIKNGATHVRTHSEFDPAGGFTGFKVILELKEKYKHVIDMQVVAFPQEGIMKAPGTEAMMHEAVKMGADVVGGIPYNDFSANDHIDLVFEIAKKYQMPLDFHQDFKDDIAGTSIEYLCRKTIAEGYQGRVSVGHMTSLGAFPPDQLHPLLELMAEAQINVMCLPATDLHLGGRNDTYNVRRALTPVRALNKAGVNVCLGSNNIRNAFTPYGNGDLFQIAMLAIPTAHLGGADDLPSVLPMITTRVAKALNISNYGLKEGCNADVVLLDTKKVSDAIIDLPDKLYVIKGGKVIIKTQRQTERRYSI
ncbi:N-acyl-D-amino-acid deacylase [Anaerosporomusa subterranea]|uniref:N-acyl-D-amino-acid deacylase n=1 Tax=Anaerosporomusa subterranea TaxID=1794912 RepID=A0A154BP60_ANASB|nr:amidohydrolase family protein [Anaerosporomusa subterranea]KYZ75803.1 N-acyl-D-amino-acid deacylase [Anaerosporomusa subterranea]